MKDKLEKIFGPSECISGDTMLKYINNELDKTEMHKIEYHLVDCEMCRDEMEGLSLLKGNSVASPVIADLNRTIEQKANEKKLRHINFNWRKGLAVAASVIVITVSIVSITKLVNTDDDNVIVELLDKEKEPETIKSDKIEETVEREAEAPAGADEFETVNSQSPSDLLTEQQKITSSTADGSQADISGESIDMIIEMDDEDAAGLADIPPASYNALEIVDNERALSEDKEDDNYYIARKDGNNLALGGEKKANDKTIDGDVDNSRTQDNSTFGWSATTETSERGLVSGKSATAKPDTDYKTIEADSIWLDGYIAGSEDRSKGKKTDDLDNLAENNIPAAEGRSKNQHLSQVSEETKLEEKLKATEDRREITVEDEIAELNTKEEAEKAAVETASVALNRAVEDNKDAAKAEDDYRDYLVVNDPKQERGKKSKSGSKSRSGAGKASGGFAELDAETANKAPAPVQTKTPDPEESDETVLLSKVSNIEVSDGTDENVEDSSAQPTESTPNETKSDLRSQAMTNYDNNNYQLAIAQFEQVLNIDQNDIGALFYSALALINLNKLDEAIQKLDKVLEQKTSEYYTPAKYHKSQILIKKDQVQSARILLEELLKTNYKEKAEESLEIIK